MNNQKLLQLSGKLISIPLLNTHPWLKNLSLARHQWCIIFSYREYLLFLTGAWQTHQSLALCSHQQILPASIPWPPLVHQHAHASTSNEEQIDEKLKKKFKMATLKENVHQHHVMLPWAEQGRRYTPALLCPQQVHLLVGPKNQTRVYQLLKQSTVVQYTSCSDYSQSMN